MSCEQRKYRRKRSDRRRRYQRGGSGYRLQLEGPTMSNRVPVVRYGNCAAPPVNLVTENGIVPEGLVDESLSVVEQPVQVQVQKGAGGFSFQLDDNVGNRPSVVSYKTCLSQKVDVPTAESVPEGVGNDNLSPLQVEQVSQEQKGGKKYRRRRKSKKSKKRSSKKVRKNKKGGASKNRKSKSKRRLRRRRRRTKQRGGDFNCPTCNMSTRDVGCSQPNWGPKCI